MTMKNLLIVFVLLFSVTSCFPKKDKDIEPDLAGTYTMTRFRSGTTELITPQSGITGNVMVTRPSDTRVGITLNVQGNGQNVSQSLGEVDLRKASGNEYDLVENGTRVGSINGTTFTIDATDDTGDRLILNASR